MLHHRLREHGIEAGVEIGQLVDRGGLEADIRNTALGRHGASAVDLGWVDVDANDLTGRDRLGKADGDRAWAAAAIQHAHAWPQVRQQEARRGGSCAPLQKAMRRSRMEFVWNAGGAMLRRSGLWWLAHDGT